MKGLGAILIFCLSLIGCVKEPCERVICTPNAYCDRDSCKCLTGYLGKKCDSTCIDLYKGVYYGITTTSTGAKIPDTLTLNATNEPIFGEIAYSVEKETFRISVHSPESWSVSNNYNPLDTIFASVNFFSPAVGELGVKGSCVRTVNQHIVESWYFVGYRK